MVAQLLATKGAQVTGAGPYVAAGWAITFTAVGAYALAILRRGRQLSRHVPAGERRWS